jgi:circadian clock protein KaiC
VREFVITNKGLKLVEIYLGPSGILVGSEREEQKLQKLTGQAFKDQQIRRNYARRRQENGIPKQSKAQARN